MDGLIILNKPINLTSHDAVNKIRKILKTKRIGHTGTLDPLASGVLILCVGNATKLSRYLTTDTKKYCAKIILGFSTDTFDLEGRIVEERKDFSISDELIDNAINSFLGKSMQTPPIYSAIKINGKKLYDYAKSNEKVKIEPREIEVFNIKRTTEIIRNSNQVSFSVELEVSKGTYIRSFASDLGKKLNIPSVLAGLERIECSNFSIDDCCTLEDIENGNYKLYNMCDGIKNIYQIENDSELIKKAKNGMKISFRYIFENYHCSPSVVAITKSENNLKTLVGIYKLDYSEITKSKYYKAETIWN